MSGLAEDVVYDNGATRLAAEEVQAAIDELAAEPVLPAPDTGDAGKVPAVNEGEDGYELVDPPSPGGSVTGAVRYIAIPFAFDDDGLEDGVDVYTPAVGDILVDAFVTIQTVWDETAYVDIGTESAPTEVDGLWTASSIGTPGLADADTTFGTLDTNDFGASLVAATVSNGRLAPAVFLTTDPLKLVVSDTGESSGNGGVATGATTGAATLYLAVCTPADPT